MTNPPSHPGAADGVSGGASHEVAEHQGGPVNQDVLSDFRTVSDLAKESEWPGGVLGLVGVLLMAGTFVAQLTTEKIDTSEYVLGLLVGALLALLGPVIIYKTTAKSQETVQKIVEDSLAERKAKLEAKRSQQAGNHP